jgi:hypothetical protein
LPRSSRFDRIRCVRSPAGAVGRMAHAVRRPRWHACPPRSHLAAPRKRTVLGDLDCRQGPEVLLSAGCTIIAVPPCHVPAGGGRTIRCTVALPARSGQEESGCWSDRASVGRSLPGGPAPRGIRTCLAGCGKTAFRPGCSKRSRCKAAREPRGTHRRWVGGVLTGTSQRRGSARGTRPQDGSRQMGVFQQPAVRSRRPAIVPPAPHGDSSRVLLPSCSTRRVKWAPHRTASGEMPRCSCPRGPLPPLQRVPARV